MCSGNVYSPKIREDLIPVLFKLAKRNNTAMTKVVDEILRHELHKGATINNFPMICLIHVCIVVILKFSKAA